MIWAAGIFHENLLPQMHSAEALIMLSYCVCFQFSSMTVEIHEDLCVASIHAYKKTLHICPKIHHFLHPLIVYFQKSNW